MVPPDAEAGPKTDEEVVSEVLASISYYESPQLAARLATILGARSAASAGATGAERASFESAMNGARFFPAELDFSRTKSPGGRDEYANAHLESSWIGWQARAAAVGLKAVTEVAAVEDLSADEIEDLMPDNVGDTGAFPCEKCGWIQVSAQWLHDFARNVSRHAWHSRPAGSPSSTDSTPAASVGGVSTPLLEPRHEESSAIEDAIELTGEDLFVPLALDLRGAQGSGAIKQAAQALLDWHNRQVRAAARLPSLMDRLHPDVPGSRVAVGAADREFVVTDPDLQAFLDAAVGYVKGHLQNMDTGLHLMSLLERVELRLAENSTVEGL